MGLEILTVRLGLIMPLLEAKETLGAPPSTTQTATQSSSTNQLIAGITTAVCIFCLIFVFIFLFLECRKKAQMCKKGSAGTQAGVNLAPGGFKGKSVEDDLTSNGMEDDLTSNGTCMTLSM